MIHPRHHGFWSSSCLSISLLLLRWLEDFQIKAAVAIGGLSVIASSTSMPVYRIWWKSNGSCRVNLCNYKTAMQVVHMTVRSNEIVRLLKTRKWFRLAYRVISFLRPSCASNLYLRNRKRSLSPFSCRYYEEDSATPPAVGKRKSLGYRNKWNSDEDG